MIRVAVGILKRGDKLLVAERPLDKPYSGFWEFPGGKIEAGESGEAALSRELLEELGIAVLKATHLFDHVYTYPDKTVQLEMWLVTEFSGEPQSLENQTFIWATLDEMKSLRLLEGNIPIVMKLRDVL